MRKFTDEEIRLCKEIAEKKIAKIKYGDWYLVITTNPLDKNDKEESVFLNTETRIINPTEEMKKDRVFYNEYVPLWQEHDCLEWLNENKWDLESLNASLEAKGNVFEVIIVNPNRTDDYYFTGKTPLEALLRAVLTIVGK